MIRVIGFALYGSQAASHRVRLEQYVKPLAQHGISLTIHSLLNNQYLERKFTGKAIPLGSVLESAFVRLGHLLRSSAYDIVMLHCELLPFVPAWVEKLLLRKPYIYDFDDAFYLRYRRSPFRQLQPVLGNKTDKIIAGAAAVTAGSTLLEEYADRYNPNTVFLPSVIDTDLYARADTENRTGPLTVGWVGSPSTAKYLEVIVEPLSALGAESALRLMVVGGNAPRIPNVEVVELPWSAESEVATIQEFDVGVMPLTDDAWARGKCAYKLVQYMGCSVPVVASGVGANTEVVTQECGFTVSSVREWIQALRTLRDDAERRIAMGKAARQRVLDRYSLARNIPILAHTITAVHNRRMVVVHGKR